MPTTQHVEKRKNPASKQPDARTVQLEEGQQAGTPELAAHSFSEHHPLDPRTLSPRAILQLQRTIGNQAVVRLLAAHKAAAPVSKMTPTLSTSQPAGEAIQRLIGFEIETGIPAKNYMEDHTLEDPDYEDFNIDLADGSKLDVDSNPSGGGKILEFASEAVDETQDPKDFRKTAAKWVGLLTGLRDKAAATPPIKRLKTDVPEAPGYARYGVNQGSPGPMDRASIQATHGLKLDQVREFLKNIALANPTGASRVKSKETASKESVPSVDPIMAEVKKHHDPATTPNVEDKHVEELAGFFTLMANYMISGKAVASGYAKNRSFLFYKSKLSDVRNKLVADNPYAAVVLTDVKAVAPVMFALLIATKRKADEALWVGTGDPKIWDWMKAIFEGRDDLAFEAAKNPWGKDIKPGKVDGGIAAVVEHRDIDKVVPPDGTLKLTEPDGILDYLTKVFEANKEWEKLKDKD